MDLVKLTELFYQENTHLVEVLDKAPNSNGTAGKVRGYGVVVIEINSLTFGIPLRSHIKHNDCFPTVKGQDECKGLDYSKAVLLSKQAYISSISFRIPNAEFIQIKQKTGKIKKAFTKYVEHYIKGVSNNDQNILKDYKFTTLQNYHSELGLTTAQASEPEEAASE